MKRPRFKLSQYVVWQYKYGADFEHYLKIAELSERDSSFKVPEAIKTLPIINKIFDQPYVDAFNMLSGSRQSGMGMGSIPLSEITNLYDRIQLGEEEDFITIIQSADNALLKAYNEDPKNKPKPKSGN